MKHAINSLFYHSTPDGKMHYGIIREYFEFSEAYQIDYYQWAKDEPLSYKYIGRGYLFAEEIDKFIIDQFPLVLSIFKNYVEENNLILPI